MDIENIKILIKDVENIKIFIELIKIFVTIVAVIIAGKLGYRYAKLGEERKHIMSLRSQAYNDLIRGVAGSALTKDINKKEGHNTLYAEAKARIGIFGSENVIHKLCNFIDNRENTGTQEGMKSFIQLGKAMRSDLFPEEKISVEAKLRKIFFSK